MKLPRKEYLEKLLTAIDLPLLVIEITFDGVKYTPKNYCKLRAIILQELIVLNCIVNI